MPLPSEILAQIKAQLEEAETLVKSTEDVVADLRASGIDASAQEEMLRQAKANLNQLRIFYGRQIKR